MVVNHDDDTKIATKYLSIILKDGMKVLDKTIIKDEMKD